jgi:hypothetical protein
MSSPIVERILAEYNTRKALREAVAGVKPERAPAPTPAPRKPEGPDVEAIITRITGEVVPMVGQAVSTEIAAGLDRVRRDLLQCVDRELSRILSAVPAPLAKEVLPAKEIVPAKEVHPAKQVKPSDEVQIESVDTDLDLRMEDVHQELERVFEELELTPASKQKTVVIRKAKQESESPAEVTEPATAPSRTAAGRPYAARPEPTPAPVAEAPTSVVERPSSVTEAPAPMAEIPTSIVERPARMAEPLPVAEIPTSVVERPAPAAPAPAAPAPAAVAPAPAAEAPAQARTQDLAPESTEAATGGPGTPLAPELLDELREAIIPGIADGVSRLLQEMEKGQEKFIGDMSVLAERVDDLEARATERPAEAAKVPTSTPASPSARPPSEEEMEKVSRLLSALIGQIGEMEKRILAKIDALLEPVEERQS